MTRTSPRFGILSVSTSWVHGMFGVVERLAREWRRRRWQIGAFLTIAAAQVAATAPTDLVIQRIEFMDCVPRIGVTVYNQGGEQVVTPFDVRLTSADLTTKEASSANRTVGGLGAYSSTRVVFGLPVRDVLIAAADPTDRVREVRDSNNTLEVASKSLVRCPTVSVVGGEAPEGTPVKFLIRMSHAFVQPVRIGFATEDGTANGAAFGLAASGTTACSADFVRGQGVIEFAANTAELVRVVEIATCADTRVEGAEAFRLRLTSIANGYTASPAAAIGTGTVVDAE